MGHRSVGQRGVVHDRSGVLAVFDLLTQSLAVLTVGFFLANCPCCGGGGGVVTPVFCPCCSNNNAPAEWTITISGVGAGTACAGNCSAINGTYVLTQAGICGGRLNIVKCNGACQTIPQCSEYYSSVDFAIECPVDVIGVVRPRLVVTLGVTLAGSDTCNMPFFLKPTWIKDLPPYAASDLASRPNCCGFVAEVASLASLGNQNGCQTCTFPGSTATITAGAC